MHRADDWIMRSMFICVMADLWLIPLQMSVSNIHMASQTFYCWRVRYSWHHRFFTADVCDILDITDILLLTCVIFMDIAGEESKRQSGLKYSTVHDLYCILNKHLQMDMQVPHHHNIAISTCRQRIQIFAASRTLCSICMVQYACNCRIINCQLFVRPTHWHFVLFLLSNQKENNEIF